ncbi:pyrroline-5-carboxylate reductase [Bacteroides helcogenes P 36-108]|uniref:Pyrroline-5-carboxylate reductase n=2 Tax=Bacteroides helcogenes TaxID=290053 RepID=E6SUA8_BACT6|nr:pyrroline-5-carboxylate reductase [Bacteroides helcogenes P 36-108]
MKVAIIGAGNMGGAIARGLAKGSIVPATSITVANPSQGKLDKLKAEFPTLHVTNDNRTATTGADLIILAVKPWLIEAVISELDIQPGAIVVSVAAGIACGQLAAYIGNIRQSIFRLIPNTAISELQSMTLLTGYNATAEQKQLLLDIFNEMGLAMWLPEEKMAAATAMTSCGIAYALKYIQAVMQAGIELGIYPKDGMKMVAQSVKGAAELILNNDTHPSVEIDKVCTPGGITIRGINELEHEGFSSALIKAIKKSV